jgi:hypothetical protein
LERNFYGRLYNSTGYVSMKKDPLGHIWRQAKTDEGIPAYECKNCGCFKTQIRGMSSILEFNPYHDMTCDEVKIAKIMKS